MDSKVPDVKQVAGIASPVTDELYLTRLENWQKRSGRSLIAGTDTGESEKDVVSHLQERPRMTPLAKKLAVQEGMQPQSAGTGLAGAARSSDLTAPHNDVYGKDYEERNISNIRKLIARSMHASLQNSAQLTHHLGADATYPRIAQK